MLVKRTELAGEIVANDGCRLRELLHPERDACDLPYSLAVAWVEPGEATLPHRLTAETEVYHILSGRGRMHVGEDVQELGPGDVVVIPAGSTQWIECLGEKRLHFAALVSPPWRVEHDVRQTPP